jgi:Bacterial PH domain
MSESFVFRPVWKNGLILHCILAGLLAGGGGFLIWLAFQQRIGGLVILCLFGALLLLALLPFIIYRAYGLFHASYVIEREGLSVRWGLRREDIPLTEIEWVRPAGELVVPLRLPSFSMPGAYLGESHHSDLGRVEFIASDLNSLVIVETSNQVLALSPEDPEDFVRTFQRTLEMGSITPISAFSSQPAEFIQNVFSYRLARISLITGLLLTLALAVVTSLLIPDKQIVSMGVTAQGLPLEPVPSNRLLLLPILGSLSLVLDIIVGLYFFRKEEQRTVSYFLWIAGMVTPLLLMVALLVMAL